MAIESCAGDKALRRPDGFTLAFFQHFWSMVKLDVMSTIGELQERSEFKRSSNASQSSLQTYLCSRNHL